MGKRSIGGSRNLRRRGEKNRENRDIEMEENVE